MQKTDQIELQKISDGFQKKYGAKTFRAILGDANGRVYEPGRPGYVRVRYTGSAGFSDYVTVRLRVAVNPIVGNAVLIGYDSDGELAVIGLDFAGMETQGNNPGNSNPSDPNQTYYIQQQRLLTFACHPVSSAANSMLVTVQTGDVIDLDADELILYEGGQFDLTAYIPGGAGEWCLACLFWKSDNTIEIFASTPKDNPDDLGIDDINECMAARTSGSLPIWAWRLYNGQTGIASGAPADGGDDFMDLRPLWFMLQAGGSGMTDFLVAGDTGTPQTITDGNTLTIAGGTGIDTVVSATDTVTVNIDSTVATLTGSQTLTNKTLTAPTITDFTNAQHDHLDADDGGMLTGDAVASAYKTSVISTAIANVNIASAPSSIDGASLSSGNRVLLTAQSTASQNGIWVFNGTGNALTRPTDYAAGNTIQAYRGVMVFSTNGANFAGSFWSLNTSGTITIDTTSTIWVLVEGAFRGSLRVFRNPTLAFYGSIELAALTANRQVVIPDADGVFVLEDAAQTLTNKTLTTPTIGNFTNANHDHEDAAGGGTLDADAIASGVLDEARLPPLRLFSQTASVTVTNTSELTILGAGAGTLTIPANRLDVGSVIRISAWGYGQRASGGFTLRIKLGGTTVLASASVAAISWVTANGGFHLEAEIPVRTTGATGTVYGQGLMTTATTTVATAGMQLTNTGTTTIDTTSALAIDVTAQWSVNNASNTITCTGALIEIVG